MAEPSQEETQAEGPSEMSFFEHLEELRWRVIKALIGVVIGMIICWIFMDVLMEEVFLKPVHHLNANLEPEQQPVNLQNLKPFGQVFLYMQVSIIGGIVLSIPNILYQLWSFIAPGLLKNERRYIKAIVVFSSACFLAGIAFAYFVILPSALHFFAGFGTLEFELPMVSWFLSRLGILTPAFMRKYRRHSIVAIFILAAVLTPGTDPVSQVLLAAPLLLLYEISILISAWASRKREQSLSS